LIPAKGIARLDIVSVLAGRSGDRKVHRGLPAAGGVIMVLSGAAVIWSVVFGGVAGLGLHEYVMVGGAVGLVLGCLMVIPALLALVGRLGTRLVLPLRLATRDTARQRGRSTPAVAAIMAAVAALTALSIGSVSDARQQEDTYKPQRPMGTGVIQIPMGDSEGGNEGNVLAVLARFAPQLEVQRDGYVDNNNPPTTTSTISWVSPAPPSCTDPQILAAFQTQDGASVCESLAGVATGVRVGSLSGLSAAFHLSKSQRAVLEAGGALITDPKLVQAGQARYVAGTSIRGRYDGSTGHAITRRTSLPVAMVDKPVRGAAFAGPEPSAWVLPGTAEKLGWPVRTDKFNLISPTGTISPEVEAAVADRLGDGYIMYVERGFQNQSWLILLIAFSVAGLLVLIASLISTALSLAESQNDMATLAAVGATRHTRRGIAASQAFVVAACGALLGVAVGMAPGIASTWPLTTRIVNDVTGQPITQPPTIVIPWLPLVAVCVAVPLLAAGLAWIAVRRHPQMTRRLA
jgi:putative ABC transport system permease protein